MTYQIADAKTRYFENKQHYLNFLNAWKKEASSDNCRLTAAHMLFYALVRGKDVRTAFVPITRENKLRNGFYINQGLYFAYRDLCSIKRLSQTAKGEAASEWSKRVINDFLAPFDDVIDQEFLFKVTNEMPEIKPLYSNYGKGVRIVEALTSIDKRLELQTGPLFAHPMNIWNFIEEMINE